MPKTEKKPSERMPAEKPSEVVEERDDTREHGAAEDEEKFEHVLRRLVIARDKL